jgi:hypothetical protein
VALSALLVTLARPATWPLALAAFLLRGGLLLVALPIVVVPSPVGLGNLLVPTVMAVVFQGVSIELAAAIGLLVLAIVGWLVVGGLVAAMLEADGARIAAAEDDLGGDTGAGRPAVGDALPAERPHRGIPARILAVRVLAHVPTGIALIWGTARLVAVAYGELTSPVDVTSPIAVRILRGAPEVVVVLVGLWMIGEIVGALGARRVSLAGAGVGQALRDAVAASLRHPVTVLVGFWVPAAGLALVVTPFALAATAAVRAARAALRSTSDPSGATVAVVVFVTIWLIGLALIAVTAAWRGAVWTVAHGALWGHGRQRGGGEPA